MGLGQHKGPSLYLRFAITAADNSKFDRAYSQDVM